LFIPEKTVVRLESPFSSVSFLFFYFTVFYIVYLLHFHKNLPSSVIQFGNISCAAEWEEGAEYDALLLSIMFR